VTDLAVFVTNTAAVRPGFDNSLHVSVANAGTTQSNATVGLKLPSGVVYVSADPQPSTVAGDSLTWMLGSVPFLGGIDISVQIQIGAAIPLGQILPFHASVTSDNTDAAPSDNDFVLKTLTVGSYDPNDKQVWPGPYISPGQLAAGEPLRYTIRFQNTGTYPAERVRLLDTLDAHLDLSTLSVLGASHPYTWRMLGGHILEVLFDQIQLPDSTSDLAGSQGFFSFSIQAKDGLALGTVLRNRAGIYFDFNAPVLTNTVVTEVSYLSGVSGVSGPVLRLYVSPNPAQTSCHIQMPAAGGALAVFDAKGTLVRWMPACGEELDLGVRDLAVGVYFLRWGKGMVVVGERLVVGR